MFNFSWTSKLCCCFSSSDRNHHLHKNSEYDSVSRNARVYRDSFQLLLDSDDIEDSLSQKSDSECIEQINNFFEITFNNNRKNFKSMREDSRQSLMNVESTIEDYDEKIKKCFFNVMNLLPNIRTKEKVLNNVISEVQKRYSHRHESVIPLWKKVIMILSEKDQLELLFILADLPPAVMGDIVAQDSSRVLVNIKDDVNDALDSISTLNYSLLVDSVSDTINEKIQEYGNVEIAISGLLESVREWEQFKCIMSNILLSSMLPHATKERLQILKSLFSSEVFNMYMKGEKIENEDLDDNSEEEIMLD